MVRQDLFIIMYLSTSWVNLLSEVSLYMYNMYVYITGMRGLCKIMYVKVQKMDDKTKQCSSISICQIFSYEMLT